jgi:hypothetical protein
LARTEYDLWALDKARHEKRVNLLFWLPKNTQYIISITLDFCFIISLENSIWKIKKSVGTS